MLFTRGTLAGSLRVAVLSRRVLCIKKRYSCVYNYIFKNYFYLSTFSMNHLKAHRSFSHCRILLYFQSWNLFKLHFYISFAGDVQRLRELFEKTSSTIISLLEKLKEDEKSSESEKEETTKKIDEVLKDAPFKPMKELTFLICNWLLMENWLKKW